jgi:hypothetical protein
LIIVCTRGHLRTAGRVRSAELGGAPSSPKLAKIDIIRQLKSAPPKSRLAPPWFTGCGGVSLQGSRSSDNGVPSSFDNAALNLAPSLGTGTDCCASSGSFRRAGASPRCTRQRRPTRSNSSRLGRSDACRSRRSKVLAEIVHDRGGILLRQSGAVFDHLLDRR